MISLIGVGWVMTDLDPTPFKFSVYGVHKAIGISVLFLAALRLIWRIYSPPPVLVPTHRIWEMRLAQIIHFFFYGAMILMPLSGWAMSSAANFPVSWFGFFTLPFLVPPDPKQVDFYKEIHEVLGAIIAISIGLHVAGAMKHHFKDRDHTLIRMMPYSWFKK